MRLHDIPTARLRRVLQATERIAGPGSPSVAMLREELAREVLQVGKEVPDPGDSFPHLSVATPEGSRG